MEKTNKTKLKRKYTRREGSKPPGNPTDKTRRHSYLQTAKDAEEKIEVFFKHCDKKKIPYTVTGLAIALGFTHRNQVLDYEKEERHTDIPEEERKLIACTIKKAKVRIENYLEINLIEGRQVAGTIFNLKNNYGYIDRQEFGVKGDITVNIKGITKF